MSDVSQADPIFIHGIMPRSGTNFLWDLLLLHPACAMGRPPIREDFFLESSDHLVRFVAQARGRWDPMWGPLDDEAVDMLPKSLGDGLVSYLWVDRARRLVAKTPSVTNLERFFTFFPNARLLILVRDGRSVVESCRATFGWDLDRAARQWAAGAEVIHRFEADGRNPTDRYLRLRYEDLLNDLERTLERVFGVCDLDPAVFDHDAARALPVRGSSSFFGPDHESVHWEPVARDPGFDPTRRWSSWSRPMLERFDWIAGEQMRLVGYDDAAGRSSELRARAKQTLLDWRWTTASLARLAAFRGRVRLGSASRPIRERLGLARPRS